MTSINKDRITIDLKNKDIDSFNSIREKINRKILINTKI